MRSVENVIQEVKDIVDNQKIHYVVFMVDTFTNHKKWVLDLCSALIEESIDFKWLCNSRVDTIDEEMLCAMKRAGCILVSYGIESSSQEILNSAGQKSNNEGLTLDEEFSSSAEDKLDDIFQD